MGLSLDRRILAQVDFRTVLLIIGASIGMMAGFAVLISATFGMFVKPISQSLGWSRTQVSLLTTAAFLGYAIGSPLIGRLYDRLGVARVQLGAIVLFAGGTASLSLLPNAPSAFALTMFVVGLTSAATSPSGYVLILTKRISTRLGLAIAVSMLGLGIGISLAPAMAGYLIDTVGWRQAYVLLAVLGLAGGIAALLLGVGREPDVSAEPCADAGTTDGSPEGLLLSQALQSWRFWLVGLTSLLIGVAGVGTTTHLAAALSDSGVAPENAVRMAGLVGLGILIGRFTAAMLMDRFFAPTIAMLCYGLGGCGLFLLANVSADQTVFLYLGSLASGLLIGSEGDTMPFLTRHYFGLRSFGSIYGCVVGMAGLGALVGPLAFGLSFDLTGNYHLILTVAAVASVGSGFSLMILGRYRYCTQDRQLAADPAPAGPDP